MSRIRKIKHPLVKADKRAKQIKETLKFLEESLANAEKYLEKGINVEGSAWLHFDDWRGNSGHPDWVKNKMIPILKKLIAKKEKALEKYAGD